MAVVIDELQTTIVGAENPMVVTCKILIDDEEIETHIPVSSVIIDREINKIPSAVVTIVDGDVSIQDFVLSNQDLFVPGKRIEIKFGYQTNAETVFKGIIIGHGKQGDWE